MTTPSKAIIAQGFCQCGCGRKTAVHFGKPSRYIRGHHFLGKEPPNKKRPDRRFLDAQPFRIDGDYCKLVFLSDGFYAIVDADSYPRLSKIAWYVRIHGNPNRRPSYYAQMKLSGSGRRLDMARLVVRLSPKDPRTVDHINPNFTWDNRRRNLRKSNQSQQQHNTRRRLDNSSGYKGVSWDAQHKKYVAQIKTNGKNRRLGFSLDPAVCAEMYRVAALQEHKEFARLS